MEQNQSNNQEGQGMLQEKTHTEELFSQKVEFGLLQ